MTISTGTLKQIRELVDEILDLKLILSNPRLTPRLKQEYTWQLDIAEDTLRKVFDEY